MTVPSQGLVHVVLSPPALLLAWLLLHSAQLSAAGGSFGALLRIYNAAPGDSPWLPFLWAVHTPLHALGAKLWWDRRGLGLGLGGGVQEKEKPE